MLHDTLRAIPLPFAFPDIACGNAGQMKRALAGTEVNHYHGIDLSEPALGLAAKNLKGVPFAVKLDHRDFVEALERRPEPADAACAGFPSTISPTRARLSCSPPSMVRPARC